MPKIQNLDFSIIRGKEEALKGIKEQITLPSLQQQSCHIFENNKQTGLLLHSCVEVGEL
jgi:hypothetical protein